MLITLHNFVNTYIISYCINVWNKIIFFEILFIKIVNNLLCFMLQSLRYRIVPSPLDEESFKSRLPPTASGVEFVHELALAKTRALLDSLSGTAHSGPNTSSSSAVPPNCHACCSREIVPGPATSSASVESSGSAPDLVICADTTIQLEDGEIIGKPEDANDAIRILSKSVKFCTSRFTHSFLSLVANIWFLIEIPSLRILHPELSD